ncbi:hypothetical protein LEP1GSC040_0337 [Leptospira santarosai str. 2000030832]|nr:hypothetical protein LEP1GSC040_0337 [Leptospira santarosai str. 2000030832]
MGVPTFETGFGFPTSNSNFFKSERSDHHKTKKAFGKFQICLKPAIR